MTLVWRSKAYPCENDQFEKKNARIDFQKCSIFRNDRFFEMIDTFLEEEGCQNDPIFEVIDFEVSLSRSESFWDVIHFSK